MMELPVPKPDHVADNLVYDFDYRFDPEFTRDPFARASQIIKEAPPVFWTPRNGGHWMITSFDAVSRAARDPESFSSVLVPPERLAHLPADMPTPMTAIPANVDPPLHGLYRAPINPSFSVGTMSSLKGQIRHLAADLIERVRPAGQCELLGDITEPLSVQMFLKLYGLPLERQEEYRTVVKQVTRAGVHDVAKILAGAKLLVETYSDTLIERRDHPRDDIISAMWKLEIDGKPITLELMQSFSLALFLAGLDTVMNAMAHGTRHLALHPELQELLRADPKRIPQVAEELLRLYAFALPVRTVARDLEFERATMKKGEIVHFFLPGANRDPAHFEAPDTFSLERRPAPHLAFGAGPHRCLGMHLARVELHVYYEELLSRLPMIRLDPDRPPVYHGGIVVGPDYLHLLWGA
jgi:cytochrome P450